jgi:hypothetical protein
LQTRPDRFAWPGAGGPVETIQIAPTSLKLLHLNPRDLQAVRIEHTPGPARLRPVTSKVKIIF